MAPSSSSTLSGKARPDGLLGLRPRPPLRSGPPPLKRRRPTRRSAGLSNRLFVCRRFELLVFGALAPAANIFFVIKRARTDSNRRPPGSKPGALSS